MAVLQINSFFLRHEGRLYAAGETVELDDSLAKALEEESDGAFTVIKKTRASKAQPVADMAADKRKTARAKKAAD